MADEHNEESSSQEGTQEKQPDLSTVVNQAVTAHVKRIESKMQKSLDDKFKSIEDKLTAITSQPETKKSKEKDGENPELAALRAQIDALKSDYQKANDRAADLEKKRKEDQVFGEVRNILTKHVRPEVVEVLSSYIFKASGKIEYDEDGTPLFKVRKSPHPGLAEEDVLMPLDAGIEAYLKTKEASPFMPAPAAAGNAPKAPAVRRSNASGGPPKWEHPANTPQERAERALQMEEYLKSKQT